MAVSLIVKNTAMIAYLNDVTNSPIIDFREQLPASCKKVIVIAILNNKQ